MSKLPVKRKPGRSVAHPPEVVWPRILELISSGQSLRKASAAAGISFWLAKRHLRADADLQRRYVEATGDRADVLAEQIEELVDEPIPAGLSGAERSAWVQHQRLRFDARRWIASKLHPSRYGDTIRVDANVMPSSSLRKLLDERERRLQQSVLEGIAECVDDDSEGRA